MKKLLVVLLLTFSCSVQAGSATINTDAATDTRLQNWCKIYMAIPGTPNAAQVKACIIQLVTQAIQASEINTQSQAITAPVPSQMN